MTQRILGGKIGCRKIVVSLRYKQPHMGVLVEPIAQCSRCIREFAAFPFPIAVYLEAEDFILKICLKAKLITNIPIEEHGIGWSNSSQRWIEVGHLGDGGCIDACEAAVQAANG